MIGLVKEYKEYVITTAVAAVLAILLILSRGIFQEKELDMIITIISDAFFIPGVLLICVGLIVYASNEGLFLSISYGFKVIGRTITAKKDERLMDEKYHEYYARQIEKKAKCKHFLIVGAAFIVISLLFVGIYFCVA
jgi:hypothetical protein